MTQEQILGAVRHTLTFLGGFAVAKGYVDASQLPELAGAVVTLLGFAWSFLAKKKAVAAPAVEAK